MTTEFQKNIYNLCKRIPKGKVTTYKVIAEKLGTKAYRAVGQALKKNKQPDIIPCFKVIRQDGSIGGYSGTSPANIKKKIEKLKSEGVIVKNNRVDISKYLYKFK